MIYLKILFYVTFCGLCATFWRMGGADEYEKLWRRLGSTLCIVCCIYLDVGLFKLINIFTFWLVFWGCLSYMGWINSIVRLFWKDIVMKREYIWNFFFENLVIQSSVLPYKRSIYNILFSVASAFIIAFVKIAVDNDKDGKIKILFWTMRKDVLSELLHGGLNCVSVVINLIFI